MSSVSYVASVYIFAGLLFICATAMLQLLAMWSWTPERSFKFLVFVFKDLPLYLYIPVAIPLGLLFFAIGSNSKLRKVFLMACAIGGFVNFGIYFFQYFIFGYSTRPFSFARDFGGNLAMQLWLLDDISIYLIGLTYILVDGGRYFEGFLYQVMLIFSMFVFGFDSILPCVIILVDQVEELPHMHRTRWADLAWIYLVWMVIAVCCWLPYLMEWSYKIGDTSAMLTMAMENPAGTRSVIATILAFAFFVAYCTPQIEFDDFQSKTSNKIFTWIIRILHICLLSLHVGAGLSVWLMVRELTPILAL